MKCCQRWKMSKRLKVLKNSLAKKESELDRRFENYFSDVKSANGQPLNDKRNGQATLDRWERKSDSIRNQKESIEVTQAAIEREESKQAEIKYWYERMPEPVKALIDSGVLLQWSKHPKIMFVEGVDKARIAFDEKTGLLFHKYLKSITCRDQFIKFRDIYNSLNREVNQ